MATSDVKRDARRDIEAVFPALPRQVGILRHGGEPPESATWWGRRWLLVEGDLDRERVESAWRAVIAAHAAPRLSLVWRRQERPLQVVHRTVEPVVEWRADGAAGEPDPPSLDPSRPPLLRLEVAPEDDGRHRLTVHYHAAAVDALAADLLLRRTLARSTAVGEPAESPACRYRDFVAWLKNRDVDAAEAALRRPLEGAQPAGTLSGLAEGTPARPASWRLERALPPELVAALEELAAGAGLSLRSLYLAAWAHTVGRFSARRDVVIGYAPAARPRELGDDLVGPLRSCLPLRATPPDDGAVEPWLVTVDGAREAIEEHAYASPERLLASLDLPPPDTAVVFAAPPVPTLGGDGLRVCAAGGSPERGGASPLTLEVGAAGLSLSCRAAAVEEHRGEALLDLCVDTLEALGAGKAHRLRDLPALPAAEAERFAAANRTSTPYPRQRAIPDLFAERVDADPEAPAVEFDRDLGYAELAREARELAARLAGAGVGPGDVVGVSLPRSADLPVALLAILRVGAAYLPLDPAYPEERLAFMIEDAGMRAVVSRAGEGALPGSEALVRIDVGAGAGAAASPDSLPAVPIPAEAPAYVVYTSGSTGRPKGVVVSHRAVVRLVCGTDYVQVGPGDRVAQMATASFDAATFEIWGPLLNGGCMVGVDPDTALEPEALASHLERRRIDVLFLTTALFNQVARVAPRAFSGLAHLLFGGEAVDPRWVRRILEQAPPGRLLHVYGPTETTTFASWHPVEEVPADAVTLPIGLPIANSRLHLVDGELSPLPAGVPGEVVLAGDGLAAAYLGRPALTAEKFVPDPFSPEPGGRLYRTGDRAHRRPDGAVVFLGRRDHQVKLRGFRIELGEVETALLSRHEVGDAVVVVREGEPGDRRLVAYVTGRGSSPPDGAAVRQALRGALPDYMVPSAVVALSSLPLNANGKVDRDALPPPPREGGGGGAAPRGAVEPVVAAVWSEVLGLDDLGRDDDFFALGGHSLLATRVVSRLRETFRVEVPLRALFERSTVAGVAAVVERAMESQRGIDAPALEPVPRDGDLPLSYAQQRLWFLNQLEPASPAYNMPVAFRVDGPLDVPALAAAVGEVVRRHEALRTRFPERGGRPAQVVEEPRPLELPVVDLGALEERDVVRQTRRLAAASARRPFDLAAGPLIRVSLLRLAAEDHGVLLCLHHIVSDGWSMGVLIGEVTALYRAFAAGEPSPLPDLAVQYADFAAWQRSWLDGEVLEEELRHWRQRLGDVPPVLELPTDRPRPAEQRYRGAGLTVDLDAELSRSLRRLGHGRRATEFMTLLAAFQVLLARWSHQPTVCVGTPIAGRTRLELEPLIGFFVNTLVLRADVDDRPSFEELLGRVREEVLEAYMHQHLPFERLVEELEPQRSLSHAPLFQVMLSLQNAPRPDLDLPGTRLSSLGAGSGSAQFDLSLDVGQPGERFSLALTYDTDLFDATTARRLLGSFRALLQGVVDDPARPVDALPLLDAVQRRQVVREWNDTEAPELVAGSWLDDFAAQVAATPDAVAATCGDASLTYSELDARARRVARRLAARGAGPDGVVPLLADRGLDLLSGIVGTLRSGAAYLPLDPHHPPARLARVLEGSGVELAVASRERADALGEAVEQLPAGQAPAVLRLEELLAEDGPAGAAPRAPGPRHLAYVIFTSGSTGVPKGPMIEHRGFLNHIRVLLRDLDLGADDRVAQNASQCFDISVWQFLGILLVGGRVVILPDPVAHDGARLLRAVDEEGITVLEIVPSLLRRLLDGAAEGEGTGSLSTLRWLIPTGEELPPSLAARWLAHFPHIPLLNAYGPAECSDDVSYARLDALPVDGSDPRVTVGRPVANVRLHVLDPGLEPVPVGVSGELCVGGPAVGRGYLGDPVRTAEAFVPDPHSREPGARLYRSGDLARHLPDGELDFLGRVDHQVKVRGLRIEPGEVEVALGAHPALAECAVVARETAPGERELVGYAAAREGASAPAPGELRRFLRGRLPDYMVPTAFVLLDALPRNTNGKLDRAALPEPERRPQAERGALVAPRTPVEGIVAEAWGEVLELDAVGLHENFFDLGGHSLLATQVLSRVRDAFAVEVPLRRLFENPTVAALAEAVEIALKESRGIDVPALERQPRDGTPLPLSLAQERLWFMHRLEPESAAYNMAMAYRFEGDLQVPALRQALAELTRRHEVLRTIYEEQDGRPVQRIGPPRSPDHPLVDLSALGAEDRPAVARRLGREMAQRPFDLERGPVLRGCALRLAPRDHLVCLTVHHIACDGWSLDILARETAILYTAAAEGAPSPLPELDVGYPDYAVWQRRWLDGEVLEDQLDHWRRRLAGAPPALDQPTDHPRPEVRSDRGAVVTGTVEAERMAPLRRLGREEEATPFLTLLAAWATLLSRWAGRDDLVVGTDVAGRDRLETEGLIGFFVSTLALRFELGDNPTFRETVRRVRGETLAAYSNQGVPFQSVVEAVKPPRDASRNPIFQVSFVMQNTPGGALEMDEVAARPVEPEQAVSPYDLSLAVQEGEDGSLSTLIRYSTDLYEAETVQRLLDDFDALLGEVGDDPEVRLATLEPASRRLQREQARRRRQGGPGLRRRRRTPADGSADGGEG